MRLLSVAIFALSASVVLADTPATTYIFPAGGRRGTTVNVRVGGLYLHDRCPWEVLGPGATASAELGKTKTIWFEGPVIPLPASQAQEDYPKDMAGTIALAADAPLGGRAWRAWTAQGACPARVFVVGDLPEIVEEEIDGDPVPVKIELPVTVNGRTFPREDVDAWTFTAKAGQPVTCSALAESLGSPLQARIEIRDPAGRPVAESSPVPGSDALVRFTPKVDGLHEARIHDLNFGGLQHYVYRLTITAGPWIDRVEPLGGKRSTTVAFKLFGQNVPADPVSIAIPADASPNWPHSPVNGANFVRLQTDDISELAEGGSPAAAPAVLNGCIAKPGEVDSWSFTAAKGAVLELDLRAQRLGSPLDAVLTIADAQGKELAKADDNGPQVDPVLRFTASADGTYTVKVADQLPSRGGPAFWYRLRIAPPAGKLRLTLPADGLTLNRGQEAKLKVTAERPEGFAGDIPLEISGLPAGVTVANASIAAGRNDTELVFKADAPAKVQAARLAIRGTAKVGDRMETATAAFTTLTQPSVEIDSLLLAVSVPTPFKVKGVYEVKYAQRGGLFTRHFTLDRGGYAGPLTVSLADKQARHLQGVAGPTIAVPEGADGFDYTVYLPPWMEIGRTSRSVVMAVGEVADPDGTKHKVSFTSINQAEQIVALIDPGQVGVELDRRSVRADAGTISVPVRVSRGVGLNVPVKVEVIVPDHIRGVTTEALTLPADRTEGTLALKIVADSAGPFNMPLLVRATALREGSPVVAETNLEVVPK